MSDKLHQALELAKIVNDFKLDSLEVTDTSIKVTKSKHLFEAPKPKFETPSHAVDPITGDDPDLFFSAI
jgi:hypothetical protein